MTKAKTERKLQEQAEFINNAVSDAIFRNEFQKENGISLDAATDTFERQKAIYKQKMSMYINEQFYKLNSLVNLVVGAVNTIAGTQRMSCTSARTYGGMRLNTTQGSRKKSIMTTRRYTCAISV